MGTNISKTDIHCLYIDRHALPLYRCLWTFHFGSKYLWTLNQTKSAQKTNTGDKVAQLVRCQTSNQRVAGSIPGHSGHFGLFLGKTIYSILLQSTQLQNGYLA